MPKTQFFFLAWDKLRSCNASAERRSQLRKESNLETQGVAVCGESRQHGMTIRG
ncbi:MAG: hypothetical protein QNJ53_12820 [Pleurocapsa sp. MO_192.B19]|nr:hypothetical protein [Pleurocapsa sp. MO_192.B19]